MYNNPYIYSQQANVDRLNEQINNLERMKAQIQQPPVQQPITQNFQLAPTSSHTMRYANTIDDVNKENVYFDTPFFSKDMSVLWIKGVKGDVKTYELNEIIPKDAKDMQIELLQAQINELKGKIENDANVSNVNAEQDTTNTTTNDEPVRTAVKKNKSTSIQKVSGSEEK